jgi:hypothetical protein
MSRPSIDMYTTCAQRVVHDIVTQELCYRMKIPDLPFHRSVEAFIGPALTHIGMELAVSLQVYLAGYKEKETLCERTVIGVVTHPVDLWSHFKDLYFPTWAKKRWPPKMVARPVELLTQYLETVNICPHINTDGPLTRHYYANPKPHLEFVKAREEGTH